VTSPGDIRQNGDFLRLAQSLGFALHPPTRVNVTQGGTSTTAVNRNDAVATTQNVQPHVRAPPQQQNKVAVLLAEDDEPSKVACRRFLMQFGCHVEETGNGLEAVTLAERTKYDIVIISTVLPSLDGMSAAELIRRFDTATPIIALGIHEMPVDVYRRRGISSLLVKPFSKQDLFHVLASQLSAQHKSQFLVPPPSMGVQHGSQIGPDSGGNLVDIGFTDMSKKRLYENYDGPMDTSDLDLTKKRF
jgi:CheY-like chemotaxis protein